MLRLLLVSTSALHEAAAGTQHGTLVLIWLIVWIAGFCLVIQFQQVDIPGVYCTLCTTWEKKFFLLFAFLYIAETFLGVLDRQCLEWTILAILYFIEANGQVTERNCDSVSLSDELYGINLACTLDAWLLLHVYCIINADNISVRFKQNYLVYLFKVVNFLYLAVMRLYVNYILRLLVEHIDLSGILGIILDLMFY